MSEPQPRTPRQAIREILMGIAARHGVTLAGIMGPSQRQDALSARQEAFHVLRGQGWTLSRIGLYFARTHTAIAYGIGSHLLRTSDERNWMTDYVIRHRAGMRESHRQKKAARR